MRRHESTNWVNNGWYICTELVYERWSSATYWEKKRCNIFPWEMRARETKPGSVLVTEGVGCHLCSHTGLHRRADEEVGYRFPSGRWWWCQRSSPGWPGRGRVGPPCERSRSIYPSPRSTRLLVEVWTGSNAWIYRRSVRNRADRRLTSGSDPLTSL